MRLLVIHDSSSLAADLDNLIANRIEPFDTHFYTFTSNADWPSHAIDFVLFIARTSPGTLEEDKALFLSSLHRAQLFAKKQQCPLLFLSSSAVFSGEQFNYEEDDPCNAQSSIGTFYKEAEEALRHHYAKTLILRSGWLFSETGKNFLTETLSHAYSHTRIQVNSAGKGCPTATGDLARVILGMALQVPLSDQLFDTYHYVSSDASIGFQFIEAIVKQAAKACDKIDPNNILFSHDTTESSPFYFEAVVLRCQKLLDNFGIHQRPWRAAINGTISEYYKNRENLEAE